MDGLAILSKNKRYFPPTHEALIEPNGLLAIGGDLTPERLLNAYKLGIFPWYESPNPILWWTPNPRSVLFLNELHISRSMRKILKRKQYRVVFDKDFAKVVEQCALTRKSYGGTWLNREMQRAYIDLHNIGVAHSISIYDLNGALQGGLYGLALGKIFFGESMFTITPNMSKVALIELVNILTINEFQLIDCQIETNHLTSLGARSISRDDFETLLKAFISDEITEASIEFEHNPSALN